MFVTSFRVHPLVPVANMQTDDVYRAQLQSAIADIKAWAKTVSSVATITENEDTHYWRLVVEPNARGACPVELMLNVIGDVAVYDIRVAKEGYEDRAFEDMKMFVPILEAIAAGDVMQRTWKSSITNEPVSMKTCVGPSAVSLWQTERWLSEAADTDGLYKETALISDRSFLPYHRSI